MTEHKNLFAAFSTVSKKAWLEKVEKDLKGKSLESLNWQLEESITLSPFHHSDDQVLSNQLRSEQMDNDWYIGETLNVIDPVVANRTLLLALEQGADAPLLSFTNVPDTAMLEKVLEKVIPNYIHLSFKIKNGSIDDYVQLLKNYQSFLSKNNFDSKELKGFLYIDDNEENYSKLLKFLHSDFPLYQCLNINLKTMSTDQTSVALTDLLLKLDHLFQRIEAAQVSKVFISLELGNNYFVEIAKVRAIRVLWANLLLAYGLDDQALIIDAHVDANAYDENGNTNMIRSMTIALAAAIGGVDRLTIRPAKANANHADRIARNVQHLLKMESYLDRVVDPAAGSFYIEKLTNLLATEAWNKFTAQ